MSDAWFCWLPYVCSAEDCEHSRVDGFAGDQWCRDCGELLDDISDGDL